MSGSIAEVAWFARVLVPQLQQQPTAGQLAGGWDVAKPRVSAVEDALAGMESTAPNEIEGARARALGDAVQEAHGTLDSLVESADQSEVAGQLAAVQAGLEAAMDGANAPRPGESR